HDPAHERRRQHWLLRAAVDRPAHQRSDHIHWLAARLNRLGTFAQRCIFLHRERARAQSGRRVAIADRERDACGEAQRGERPASLPIYRDRVGEPAPEVLDAVAARRWIEPWGPVDQAGEARQIDEVGQRRNDLVGAPHRWLARELPTAAYELAEQRT